MDTSLLKHETKTWRLATFFHFVSLGLLLASIFLPEAWGLYLAFLVILGLWVPSTYLIGGRGGGVVRSLAVVAFCLFVATSDQLEQTPRFADEGVMVVVGLGVSWLICALCVPEGIVFSFPLGLLGLVTAALRVHTENYPNASLVALATLALIASGAMLFIDRFKHPGQDRSLFNRTSMWRFSPHLFVGLVAAALMLSTVDFFEANVGWLAAKLPAADSESRICELIAQPPQPTGRTICMVNSRQGPLPDYLAEKFYFDYYSGVWLPAESCHRNLHYGMVGDPEEATTWPSCQIELLGPRATMPVPFGVFHNRQAPPDDHVSTAGGAGGRQRAQFSWSPDGRLPHSSPEDSYAREAPDLERLVERAKSLCRGIDSDLGKTIAIGNYLRRHFRYDAVSPFMPVGDMDPCEVFLFVTGKGWCIHFATAGALMLRAVGVPTRLVTGYAVPAGDGVVAVLDSHAHAWCEAYLQTETGPRWVIVDPAIIHLGSASGRRALPRGFAGLALAACALVALLVAFLKSNTRQLRKEAALDAGKPDAELVVAIFERVVAALMRKGIRYRRSETPGQFAATSVPPYCRDDVAVVVHAYEWIRYMGRSELGREAMNQLVAAEQRLLKAPLARLRKK